MTIIIIGSDDEESNQQGLEDIALKEDSVLVLRWPTRAKPNSIY